MPEISADRRTAVLREGVILSTAPVGGRTQALLSCPQASATRTGACPNRRFLPGSHHSDRRDRAPAGVLHTLFHSDQGGHEQVVLCQDRASGLKAVIAIHSTALGPALGGTRFYPYATEEEAVADALNLARGMSYKNAMAGLDHGGGKAVIIGDPDAIKTEELLLAYGRFVASLGGRYVTACDVGTYVADMDVVARECRWTTGRSPENGGAGDSSVLTAFGVFQGMRASAQHLWGDPTLRGRRVGIAGVGKVGHHLVEHLLEDGAEVVITDVREEAVRPDPRPAPAGHGGRRHRTR